jgi:hypothetical protein
MKILASSLALLLMAAPAPAQDATAAPAAPPFTPSIKLGITLFADYTINQTPEIRDADGNRVTLNAFQVTRSYLNVTGNVSRRVAFRITPDIARETGAGSSLSGSYTFRLKYAYAQWNLDDYMTAGSHARFGMQPTPWVGFIDEIYRYRFQGSTFEDREGFLSSSDVGASFRYSLPGDRGDVQAAVYNGETYSRAEVNDQKAFMARATFRPLPADARLRGLRVTGFYDKDAYVKQADRTRAILAVTFEHPRVNAAFNYLAARDQNASAARTPTEARGWSAWVTPKLAAGWEALLRVDALTPDRAVAGQHKRRTIAGLAYWLPLQGNLATALLFDVERVRYQRFEPSRVAERRIAVHALMIY